MSDGLELVAVLRDGPTRRVCRVRRGGASFVTRTLTATRVQRHFGALVRHAVLDGRGSFAALGDEIAMTLEGHAIAARLLPDPGDPPRWPRAVDAGVDADGHVFLTTTWIEGQPLHKLEQPLVGPARERATLAILEVVAALHEQRVAHGDLKLSNLVLRPDGGVGLIDLDTLREVPRPDVGAPTRDRTEAWAAPEQLERHESWLGSDLWALARVLRELWGDELPAAWGPALRACRAREPADRPTIHSLRDALLTGGPCVDHRGAPCADVPEPPPTPVAVTLTERVAAAVPAGATERVGPSVTERVPESPAVPARPPGVLPAPPAPAPPLRPPVARSGGCLGLLEALGKGAVAAALVGAVLLCTGLFGLQKFLEYHADQEAERLMADVRVHKTDPAKNGPSQRDALQRRAAALVDDRKTARTCAVHALTLVWSQRWHFDAPWSQKDFDQASLAVNDPLCRREVESALARATLYAGACRRRDAEKATVEDCTVALQAVEDFWRRVPEGNDAQWLRIEGAWQEVRARSALAGRYLQTGNALAQEEAARALERCEQSEAGLGYAPVNGPELVEECMVVAGHVADVDRFLHFADLRLQGLPTDKGDRRRILTQLYESAGPDCRESKLTWSRRGALGVTGPPWCVALGHAARGCPEAAAETMAEAALGDGTHPWSRLGSALATRSGPCLQ